MESGAVRLPLDSHMVMNAWFPSAAVPDVFFALCDSQGYFSRVSPKCPSSMRTTRSYWCVITSTHTMPLIFIMAGMPIPIATQSIEHAVRQINRWRGHNTLICVGVCRPFTREGEGIRLNRFTRCRVQAHYEIYTFVPAAV